MTFHEDEENSIIYIYIFLQRKVFLKLRKVYLKNTRRCLSHTVLRHLDSESFAILGDA